MIRCQGAHVPDVRARPDQREAGPPLRRAAARAEAGLPTPRPRWVAPSARRGQGPAPPEGPPARTGDHDRGRVSKVEMATAIVLIYKGIFPLTPRLKHTTDTLMEVLTSL